ncbi:hypothetical protein BD770DRAFT_429569 [Pilaira anomala]|nr:hypothetical protein BD770DRAFT_429569 [Pilaira anomala]
MALEFVSAGTELSRTVNYLSYNIPNKQFMGHLSGKSSLSGGVVRPNGVETAANETFLGLSVVFFSCKMKSNRVPRMLVVLKSKSTANSSVADYQGLLPPLSTFVSGVVRGIGNLNVKLESSSINSSEAADYEGLMETSESYLGPVKKKHEELGRGISRKWFF